NDLVELFAVRAESSASRRDVEEQVFDGNLGPWPTSHHLGFGGLAWLWRCKHSVEIVRPPPDIRVFGSGGDAQVGNMADACQGLSSKPISANRGEVFKLCDFGRRVPLTQNGQVFPLPLSSAIVKCSGTAHRPSHLD